MGKYAVRGWCPTITKPMLSGDGYLVRIYPQLGLLDPEQLRGIAELGIKFGNTKIDLSNRGSLQIRGVNFDVLDDLSKGLKKLKIISDLVQPTSIICSPFWSKSRKYLDLVDNINIALSDIPELPKKYSVAIDLEDRLSLGDLSANIRLEALNSDQYIIRPNKSYRGLLVPLEKAHKLIYQITKWFLNKASPEKIGQTLSSSIFRNESFPNFGFEEVEQKNFSQEVKLGVFNMGVLVGVPFGELDCKTLLDLASLEKNVRVTPWRSFFIKNIKSFSHPNLISNAEDPIVNISACIGKPGCLQANVETRALAQSIAKNEKMLSGKKVSFSKGSTHIHVSGCSKGCANPSAAKITLVGQENEHFNVVVNGKSTDTPTEYNVGHRSIINSVEKILSSENGV